jgi:hypothetical protein
VTRQIECSHGFSLTVAAHPKAEPDVTGVYRRVKSRKGAKKSLSNISIEKFGQQSQQNKSPTKNEKSSEMKKSS